MTTELILLLGIYAFLVIGAFLGDLGPIETFKKSAPRFAAKLERDVSVGYKFKNKIDNTRIPGWQKPGGR